MFWLQNDSLIFHGTMTNKKIFNVLFQKKSVAAPKAKAMEYTIPRWQAVAPTYPEAVQKVLDALEASRPFYNYRKNEIDGKHLRETERKKELMSKLTADRDDFITFHAQMGTQYTGKSVKEARELFGEKEFGLGAYEVGCILFAHADLLKSSDDLFIDCAGDEFHDPRNSGAPFDRAPIFFFLDDKLGFGTGWYSLADVYYGSATGFI